MKTQIVQYVYRTDQPDEAAAYDAMVAMLREAGYNESMRGVIGLECYSGKPESGVVELDTKHLFSNQWNTLPMDGGNGYRVFDWYEEAAPNRSLKRGHYLIITDEMAEARQNRYTCGYCGHQTDTPETELVIAGKPFCNQCLGSEYLKEPEIYLTRLRPVAEHFPKRDPLTTSEEIELIPLYRESQTTGRTARERARIAKRRQRVADDYAKDVRKAETRRDLATWFLDRGMRDDNVVYYDHTDTVCFGWRTPLTDAEVSRLLDVISGFPWEYRIKRQNGAELKSGGAK